MEPQQLKNVKFDKPGFGNLISKEEALKYVIHFKKIHGKTPDKPPLTRAVWFDREVFEFIASELKRDSELSGIRVYLGAYDAVPGGVAADKDQISIFIVPTRSGTTGGHVSDWDFFKIPETLVLNHGRLCPPEPDCTDEVDG